MTADYRVSVLLAISKSNAETGQTVCIKAIIYCQTIFRIRRLLSMIMDSVATTWALEENRRLTRFAPVFVAIDLKSGLGGGGCVAHYIPKMRWPRTPMVADIYFQERVRQHPFAERRRQRQR